MEFNDVEIGAEVMIMPDKVTKHEVIEINPTSKWITIRKFGDGTKTEVKASSIEPWTGE